MSEMHNNTPCSIIIPTYQEVDNIPELVQRLSRVDFGKRLFEVILVDDSSGDGIETVTDELRAHYPWLQLKIRKGERGLSRAVIEGFQAASYPFLIMMDADLSHPPEKIPELLAQLEKTEVDMVVGSRYIKGGSIDEIWPLHRKIISRCSAKIAKLVLPTRVNDPLSGFLAIKKQTFLLGQKINPIGWKISLEMMVKCHCHTIVEIPINFAERKLGASKLNINVGLDYLKQIKELFMYKYFKTI